jgi:hypothetical protein
MQRSHNIFDELLSVGIVQAPQSSGIGNIGIGVDVSINVVSDDSGV